MDTDVYKLEARLDLDKCVKAPNICDMLSEDDLTKIGNLAKREFELDLNSRHGWEEKTDKVMELAMQIVKDKSFPWPNAANVKFPLLAIASMQYAARAYPSLVIPNDLVKYQVFGDDPGGQKNAQGLKISKHMTYQLTEEDPRWEEGTDRALLVQPLVGCAFKKIYFDPLRKRNRSVLVFPRDLVISYYSRDLESAPRLSHIIPLFPNDILERVRRGFFLSIPDLQRQQQVPAAPDKLEETRDRSQGLTQPVSDSLASVEYVEQCRTLDLDGDGYAEPYAVTFHRQTGRVVRIIARYATSDILRNDAKEVTFIEPVNYYEKYPFVPSPDGGIYDLGFGHLLYPINDSINTIINQLIDAGTLQNLGGGFLGRGAKIKSGNTIFQAGEWKQVDSTGDDLRKSIYPLPAPQPSTVLFQLLGLLIQYAERLGNSVEQMVGDTPDQNTPAETSRNALEQGMMMFSSIFKRTYRALKGEFQKLYRLNQLYLSSTPQDPYGITNKDYDADPVGIRPAADPNVMSASMRIQQAQFVYGMSAQDPGVNRYLAGKGVLEAMKYPNTEMVYPDPKGPNALPPPGPSAEMLSAQSKIQQVQVRAADTEAKHKLAAAKLQIAAQESAAKIAKMQAEAAQLRSQAAAEDRDHALAQLQVHLDFAQAQHDATMGAIQTLNQVVQTENEHDIAKRQLQQPAPAGP